MGLIRQGQSREPRTDGRRAAPEPGGRVVELAQPLRGQRGTGRARQLYANEIHGSRGTRQVAPRVKERHVRALSAALASGRTR